MRDALLSLHSRLICDTRQSFVTLASTHDSADIETTPEGRAWLDDHDRYLDLLGVMERDGDKPELLLHQRFGYVLSDETALDRSRRSPGGVQRKRRLARKRRRR